MPDLRSAPACARARGPVPDPPSRPRGALESWRARRPHVELEVVIPALDEEDRLPRTLARTLEYLGRQSYSSAVVVVDNGSVDGTADVVRAAMGGPVPVHLIGCARRGKGSAVRRGMATGRSRYVGFMDADLATPVEVLDQAFPLLQSGAAAVIGSRHTGTAVRAVPQGVVRRIGGGAFRVAVRSLLTDVSDSQCGFKFFSGPEVRAVLADCRIDGFSFDVELLARLQRSGHRVTEVPVVWTDVGGSSFKVVRHGVQSFRETAQIHRQLSSTPRSAPPPRTVPLPRSPSRAASARVPAPGAPPVASGAGPAAASAA